MRQRIHEMFWAHYLYILLIVGNIVLLLVGLLIVPATLTAPDGVGQLLGTICMQLVLATLALFGPWSFQQLRPSIGLSFVLGGIFALLYLGDIVIDFRGGSDPINIYALFVSVALVAGFMASYHTRQWQQGLLAAIWALVIGTTIWSAGVLLINYVMWGSHQQYVFWLNDGAIDDFHRSGSTNLSMFLLQDLQGALFFHPLLSGVLGAICGFIGSVAAQSVIFLQRSLRPEQKQQ